MADSIVLAGTFELLASHCWLTFLFDNVRAALQTFCRKKEEDSKDIIDCAKEWSLTWCIHGPRETVYKEPNSFLLADGRAPHRRTAECRMRRTVVVRWITASRAPTNYVGLTSQAMLPFSSCLPRSPVMCLLPCPSRPLTGSIPPVSYEARALNK